MGRGMMNGAGAGAIFEYKKDAKAKAEELVATLVTHNSSNTSHTDIRGLITTLTNRLNALADSDDITLDQLSEIVDYIKNNKDLIDAITTSKVSVTDIVNDLLTNAFNKPLSAAQGVVLKGLIDDLTNAFNNHTHKYAGSASVGGAANSAVKLTTARKINGVSFDGSSDVIVYGPHETNHTSSTLSTNGWYRIGTIISTHGFSCRLIITSIYSYNFPISVALDITAHYGSTASIVQVSSHGEINSTLAITKVRTVKKAGSEWYIEIYYAGSTNGNQVYVSYTNVQGISPGNIASDLVKDISFAAGSIPDGYISTEFSISIANPVKASAFEGDLVGNADTSTIASRLTQHSISAAPITGSSAAVSVSSAFTAGGVTFPAYAKGLFSSVGLSNSDAILLTVDVDGHINTAYRNGANWQNGRTMLDSNNYNSYAPTNTGTGASGDWNINIKGSAAKLTTARTISLIGDVTGSVTFDGSDDVSITTTVSDDSHNHTSFQRSEDQILTVNNMSSAGTNGYIKYQVNSGNKAATGYYKNMAFISNETTSANFARIGVTDNGVPQYWPSTNPAAAKNLIHSDHLKTGTGNYIASSTSLATGSFYFQYA